jgi:hypothetical protein
MLSDSADWEAMRSFRSTIIFLACLAFAGPEVLGHPIPDLPVRGYFHKGGAAILRVEVDPRCFAKDAEQEPYLQKWVLDESSEAEKKKLFAQARELISKSITFHFEPGGQVEPDFEWRFTSHDAKRLLEDGDPVVMTAEWKTVISKEVRGYRIKALDDHEFAVPFINHFEGKPIERVAVLFPGEESFLLDLSRHQSKAAAKQGPRADAGAEPRNAGPEGAVDEVSMPRRAAWPGWRALAGGAVSVGLWALARAVRERLG